MRTSNGSEKKPRSTRLENELINYPLWIVAKRCMFLVLLVMLFAASSGVVTTTEFGGG